MLKLSFLTKALLRTMHKIKYFVLFVGFIAITIAFIGRELFAYRVKIKEDGKYVTPRINFDNFYHSIIAAVLSYYNDDWNIAMYEIWISIGHSGIVFYMFLIIVGQMTLIILLKALILNYFIKSTSKEFFNQNNKITFKPLQYLHSKFKNRKPIKKPTLQPLFKKIPHNKTASQPRNSEVIQPRVSNSSWKQNNLALQRCNTLTPVRNLGKSNEKSKFAINSLNKNLVSLISMEITNKSILIENPAEHKISLFQKKENILLFGADGYKNYKRMFYTVLNSKIYQYFMFFVTLSSMVLQILDSKFEDPESTKQIALKTIDRVLGVVYLAEFALNVLTYGLIMEETCYLRRNFYNKLDFLNCVVTFGDFFVDKSNFRLFQTLKIVRTFRILKIATKSTDEIQLISKAFAETLPNFLVLIFFFLIFLVFFSLIATLYFKGTLFHCENYDLEAVIRDKWDCFDVGGNWLDEDISYNNVFKSMLSLFQISSCQGWIFLMNKAVDGKGIDQEPVEEYNDMKAIFFLVYFFVSNFILLNMFVGIIIENIIINKNKASKLSN